MLLRRTERLPEGADWLYQLKLDGYRAIGVRNASGVHLWSRNENDFGERYPMIRQALTKLPPDTVVDGEIVALDNNGRPSFNALQNYASSHAKLVYYLFDVMMLAGRDLRQESLSIRNELLAEKVLPRLTEPIRPLPDLPGTLDDLIGAVRQQGLGTC